VTKAKYNHVVVETVLLPKYNAGAQISEMGGACSTHGGERRGECRVLVGKPERNRHLEYHSVDGRIILK